MSSAAGTVTFSVQWLYMVSYKRRSRSLIPGLRGETRQLLHDRKGQTPESVNAVVPVESQRTADASIF